MSSSYKKPGFDSKYFEQLLNSLPALESKTIAITGAGGQIGYALVFRVLSFFAEKNERD